jgi:hypothetical protein
MLEFELPPGLLDGEPPSWYAVIRSDELHAQEYDGTPRAAPEGAEPRILIMEPGDESDVFISSYDGQLRYLTDSWYPTREAAVADCETEFGDHLGPWTPIPEDEPDVEKYALTRIGKK